MPVGVVVARIPFSRKKHNENNAFRIFWHRKMTLKRNVKWAKVNAVLSEMRFWSIPLKMKLETLTAANIPNRCFDVLLTVLIQGK